MGETRKTTWRIPTVAFLVGLTISAVLFATLDREPKVVEIHTSWGFDLANEAEVASYADFILAGTVVQEIGVDDDQTVFVVDVDEWVKGKTPDRIRVSQTGFKMGDTTWEVEEQPLMTVGFRYVLLLTTPPSIDSDTLTVMGGPLSAQLFSDNRIAQLRDGFEKATWPAALRDDYEATYRMASDTWAQANSGFAIPRQDSE